MATKKDNTNKNTNKIYDLLVRDNKTIQKDRAERVSISIGESFDKVLMDERSKLRKLEDKRAKLLDMSASNVTTTRNAIDKLESDEFAKELCELELEIELQERTVSVYEDAKSKYVG